LYGHLYGCAEFEGGRQHSAESSADWVARDIRRNTFEQAVKRVGHDGYRSPPRDHAASS
jgi:hypothetical protein